MGVVLNIFWIVILIAFSDVATDAARWFRRRQALNLTCKKHPKYKAIRKPQCSCMGCRKMWRARNGK